MEEDNLVRLYRLLLGLYPPEFRRRLGDEMVSVFSEAVSAARQEGDSAARVVLRELAHYPGNLLAAYAQSWQRLQPEPAHVPHWQWIVGWSFLGCAVMPLAWLLAGPIALVFLLLLRLPGAARLTASSSVLTMLGFVTAVGLTMAIGQWLLLRRRLPHAGWWLPVTFAAWLFAAPLVLALDLLFHAWLRAPLPMLALLGVTVGTVQWLLLRRLLPHAIWWLPANLLAFSTLLLVGDSFNSLGELATFLILPHLVTGTVLWLLMRQASAEPAPTVAVVKPATKPRAPVRPYKIVVALLLLLVLAIVGPLVYAVAQIELAKRDGIYASPAEGLVQRAAEIEGARLMNVSELQTGPNWSDGRMPHVGFAVGRVIYDRPPPGWDRNSSSVGSYYIRVRGGWVHMSEGVFPPFVGRVMEVYNLEGAGADGQ